MVDVSCQYKTGITQLNVPVTIARKVSCSNPIVKQNGSQINSVPYNGKVIFDVIPGNKYTIQCQESMNHYYYLLIYDKYNLNLFS